MSATAPMHVPVELRRSGRGRWFRLTTAVAPNRLSLLHVLPDDVDGPLEVAFHLPGDRDAIRCRGRAAEELVGSGEDEHAERRAIEIDVDETARARIEHYITERSGLSP